MATTTLEPFLFEAPAAHEVAAIRSLARVWGPQLEQARQMFLRRRYGCWCGPGRDCPHTKDKIDECCKVHDKAYDALGVTSTDPPGPGMIGMWSADGLKRTMSADIRLMTCTQATILDSHFYGPTAALYRGAIPLIFGPRVAAARWLIANGL
jgi:hypothetical protein